MLVGRFPQTQVNSYLANAGDFGADPSVSETANTTAIQTALNLINFAGGGTLLITKPGTYKVTPSFACYPNTTIYLGGGVTLQRGTLSNIGIMFNTTYTSNNVSQTWVGTTTGASSVMNVTGGDCSFIKAGSVLSINSGTNFIAGTYVVVSSTANTITFNKAISTGNGSALVGAIGVVMFRDGQYDIDGTRSDNIIIEGSGTIDMTSRTPTYVEFMYTTWFRKTSHSSIRGINFINSSVQAITLGDCTDTMVDGITYNVPRAVIQVHGPLTRSTFQNFSGTAHDNTVALVPASGAPTYPTDQFPNTGFGNINTVLIRNINSVLSYNPIRIVGGAGTSVTNVHIHGIRGTMWTGGLAAGRYAVALMDDGTGLTGATIDADIQDVDMTCLSSGGDSGLVYVTASQVRDVTMKNLRVTGAWRGVLVGSNSLGASGFASRVSIDDIACSETTDIGANPLIDFQGISYGCTDVTIKNFKCASSTTGPAINISDIAGSTAIFISDVFISGKNLKCTATAANIIPSVQMSNTRIKGIANPIEIHGGAWQFTFNGHVFDGTSGVPLNVAADANTASNAVPNLFEGTVSYQNMADLVKPSYPADNKGVRVNSSSIFIHHANNFGALPFDTIRDTATFAAGVPSIFKSDSSGWVALST